MAPAIDGGRTNAMATLKARHHWDQRTRPLADQDGEPRIDSGAVS
jgi:hypothetical protein